MDIINKYKIIDDGYKNNVNQINTNIKKSYFNFTYTNNTENKIRITSFDDMFDILYVKHKYLNNNIITNLYSSMLSSLNHQYIHSGNIVKDILSIINKYSNLNNLLHDRKWIISNYNSNKSKKHYFDAEENQTLIYNSSEKSSLNYKEFKQFIIKINYELQELNKSYENYVLKVDLFEDEKYDMIWIIIDIKKIDSKL
jgi:hypothetical protein